MDESLRKAIKIAGGVKAVADLFDIKSQAVSQWSVCPANRVLALESATGVSRHDLRPDVFGREPTGQQPAA